MELLQSKAKQDSTFYTIKYTFVFAQFLVVINRLIFHNNYIGDIDEWQWDIKSIITMII